MAVFLLVLSLAFEARADTWKVILQENGEWFEVDLTSIHRSRDIAWTWVREHPRDTTGVVAIAAIDCAGRRKAITLKTQHGLDQMPSHLEWSPIEPETTADSARLLLCE